MAMATMSVLSTMDMAAMYRLSKNDVPDATISGKSPDDLNMEQLKWWLSCQGALRSGKRLSLFNDKVMGGDSPARTRTALIDQVNLVKLRCCAWNPQPSLA